MICPIRRKYDFFVLLILAITLLGAIPMGFCDKLEGFFLVYFIVYLSAIGIGVITICILFPFIRKAEIKFFKNIYSIENMERVATGYEVEDYIQYTDGFVGLEFSAEGLKNLENKEAEVIPYESFEINASYQCNFAGEIYKVFINFKSDDDFYSLQLNYILYPIIKSFNIKVKNLQSVLNDCEKNLNVFFKNKKLRKESKKTKSI